MLLTPGPTPVPEFVRVAMSGETIHHRTPEFESIFGKTRELLIELFGMEDAVMLVSSGTGAMEACVTSFTEQKALTINSGKFGERFGKICDAYKIPKVELKYEWDTPSSVEDVVSAIQANPDIDAVFIQICESAGGLRHPVEEIAKAVKALNPNIMIVADGITAIGVEKIDITNLDAVITGSQKALMLPPGLAMVGLSKEAIKRLEVNAKGYYLNLYTELKKQRENTTAWTAATTLTMGLKAILEHIKATGYDKLYTSTASRAKATREALKAIGLSIYPKSPADSMTTIFSEHTGKIRKILKEEFDVNIAGGQDHLKGKIFRINHMGLVSDYEAAWAVNAVELALDKIGVRKFDGTANTVFNKIYFGV
jgi:aspartate aminotransferase-like enzyme